MSGGRFQRQNHVVRRRDGSRFAEGDARPSAEGAGRRADGRRELPD